MKQLGPAYSTGPAGGKVEPKPKAVSVEAVSNIGLQQINYKKVPLYEGRGLKAPMGSECTHKSGSQGRH